jgi:hypothetical protein
LEWIHCIKQRGHRYITEFSSSLALPKYPANVAGMQSAPSEQVWYNTVDTGLTISAQHSCTTSHAPHEILSINHAVLMYFDEVIEVKPCVTEGSSEGTWSLSDRQLMVAWKRSSSPA